MALRRHSVWAWVAFAALAVTGLPGAAPSPTLAFPQPLIVSDAWEYTFKHQTPRPIAVRSVTGEFVWYWYLQYSVENRTGKERFFAPEFELATDQGDLIRGNHQIPPAVFIAIKNRVGNDLLENPVSVPGRFLQGADHLKESVVIWRAPEGVNQLRLFVAGLSGETQRLSTGRVLQVTDKNKNSVIYNGPLITEAHRRSVPRGVGRKLPLADKFIDELKELKSATHTEEIGPALLTIVSDASAWNITLEDPDHRLVLVQKKSGVDQVLRKQYLLDYALPGKPVTPQEQEIILSGEEWVIR